MTTDQQRLSAIQADPRKIIAKVNYDHQIVGGDYLAGEAIKALAAVGFMIAPSVQAEATHFAENAKSTAAESPVHNADKYRTMTRDRLAGGHLTDEQVAYQTAMLMRDDINFEGVLALAKHRIRWLSTRVADLEAAIEWQPIETAKKDRKPVLILFKNPIPAPGRNNLDGFHGIQAVMRHPGVDPDGFDIGWGFAAPVGMGGFPDEWIAGWKPLSDVAPIAEDTSNG